MRYSAEDRKRLIQEYRASGQSKAAYCREQRVNLGTFCGWMKRCAPQVSGFAEVTVAPAISMPAGTGGDRVEVRFPGGISVLLPNLGSSSVTARLIREVVGC